MVASVDREIREADRRVVGADDEPDPLCDHPARHGFPARGLGLVVGLEDRHLAAVPEAAVRIQLAHREPDAAQLV